MRARVALACGGALVAGLAACGGSGVGTGPATSDFSGRYAISQVNGAPLPFVVNEISPRILLTAGELVVQTRGRVLDVRTQRIGENPVSTDSASHPYVVRGDRIIVTRESATAAGRFVDTLSVGGGGSSITFQTSRVVTGHVMRTGPVTIQYVRIGDAP
jgi:hypothetical protein